MLNRWKWALVPTYFIAAYVVWANRNFLFDLGNFDESALLFPVFNIARHIVLIGVGGFGLIGLVSIIRKPLFESMMIGRDLKKIGFKNSEGEYAALASKRRDSRKKHGVIYTFKNNGLSLEAFERNRSALQTVLNGKIYQMESGKWNMKTTHVHVLPKKYDVASVIAPTYEIYDLINLLVVGATGTGKSYALAAILGSVARFTPDVSITICDYKKSSFAQFEDTPNFYGYENVPDGIRAFYREFSERLEANDEKRNAKKRVLLIDEYGALIAAQDKQAADELKMMVANMLFMGRSLGIVVLIGVQRADAEHFKAGARDQFKAILALGNLSKEQKMMLFADHKDELTDNNGVGEGYLLEDGRGIERVKVALIDDFDGLNQTIRQAMCRRVQSSL